MYYSWDKNIDNFCKVFYIIETIIFLSLTHVEIKNFNPNRSINITIVILFNNNYMYNVYMFI